METQMTLVDCYVAVDVLRTPIGLYESGDSPRVMHLRELLKREYDRVKQANPQWSFTKVSRYVRADWLWKFQKREV